MASVLFITAQVLAQGRTVSGKITDQNGNGLPASVTVKGTKIGTTTDAQGNFSITVPNNTSFLVVTSIGYGESEIGISGKTTITAQLKPAGQDMD